MAERFCSNCNKKTSGILINYSDIKKFKCSECKKEQIDYQEKKSSTGLIFKGRGWGAGGINRL